jgi:hypothetical protein
MSKLTKEWAKYEKRREIRKNSEVNELINNQTMYE